MTNLHLILTLICCMHTLSSAAGEEERTFLALSFGKTTGDYIQFTPADMSPFQSSLTGCAWIKRQHDASRPIVLHFNPSDEIIMGSDGYWNYVKGNLDLRGRFPGKNVWFHYCLSWSAGGEQKVYINGEEVGSRSASSSNLRMGGDISIGLNEQSTKYSYYVFGGQLFKLNLFSEVLSSSEIRQMSEAGMCSSIEMKHETRKLKWERILTEPRYGNVVEFEECSVGNLVKKLDDTTSKLEEIQENLLDKDSRLNWTNNKLQQVMTTLNSTVDKLEETSTQLNNSLEQLKESEEALFKSQENFNSTKQKLAEVSETLNDTRSELAETKIQLVEAQNEIRERDTRLNRTDDQLQEVMTTLNNTVDTLEETSLQLNNSLDQLKEAQNEIKEKERTLNDTHEELTETQAQLLEADGALEELDARLNESLSRQEECDARLNESLSRQEECGARLNESLSRQEEGRNLDEVSRWDVLYTSPYLNKLFTRQLYDQLIGSWGMMGKSFCIYIFCDETFLISTLYGFKYFAFGNFTCHEILASKIQVVD